MEHSFWQVVAQPYAVQYRGIAFHELCTNSAKYDVLSGHQGIMAVTWGVADHRGVHTFKWCGQSRTAPNQVDHEKGVLGVSC